MKKILAVIPLFVVIGGGLFYWYEYRPSRIKHDCSWVKYMEGGQVERPTLSENELKEKGLLKDCMKLKEQSEKIPAANSYSAKLLNETIQKESDNCLADNKWLIEDYKSTKPAVPSMEKWRQATSQEYQFCLHDKGL